MMQFQFFEAEGFDHCSCVHFVGMKSLNKIRRYIIYSDARFKRAEEVVKVKGEKEIKLTARQLAMVLGAIDSYIEVLEVDDKDEVVISTIRKLDKLFIQLERKFRKATGKDWWRY